MRQSYHASSLLMNNYAAPPELPRLLAQALAGTIKEFSRSFCNKLRRMYFFIFLSSTGSSFRSLPKIPHCCHRELLLWNTVIRDFKLSSLPTVLSVTLWLSLRIIGMEFLLRTIYLNLKTNFLHLLMYSNLPSPYPTHRTNYG